MKSYGRAPSFLAMTGFEQVRSVVAALDGDLEAADRVELVLPETGVCNGAGAFDDPDAVAAGRRRLLRRPGRCRAAAGHPRPPAASDTADVDDAPTEPRRTCSPAPSTTPGCGAWSSVLSTVQIVSWGVLYYAFAALQSSITADTGWSSVAVTGAFSLAQFVSGGVGHLGRPTHRRLRPARRDDGGVAASPSPASLPSRSPRTSAVFYLGWVLTGRRDGRHAVPAGVRRPDPLGRRPPGASPDHADAGRRPGQHRLRAPGLRPRRLARVATGVPRAPRRARPHHRPAALVGPRPRLALAHARHDAPTPPADAHADAHGRPQHGRSCC